MKPLRLKLEGFLSYSEPVDVDLSTTAAVAIVGENGSGKTSLVEAMGWALFGKGRFSSPDSYVSFDRSICRVSFDFEMAGRPYRVTREREREKKSSLALYGETLTQIRGADEQIASWVAFGGSNISEVEASVERVLGLDFETWLATSYIGQGRADAFTRLRPAERKALLGEVLQLDQYAALADDARARAKSADGEISAIEREVERLEVIAADLPGALASLDGATKERVVAEHDVGDVEKSIRNRRRDLESARERLVAAGQDVERLAHLREGREAKRMLADTNSAAADRRVRIASSGLAAAQREAADVRHQIPTEFDDPAPRRARAAALDQEATEHDERASDSTSAAARASAGADAADLAIQRASARIRVLQGDESAACPTCGQNLEPRARADLLRALEGEMLSEDETRRKSLDAARTATSEAREARTAAAVCRSAAQTERDLVESISRQMAAADALAGRLPALDAKIVEQTVELGAATDDAVSARDAVAKFETPTEDEIALEASIDAGAVEIAKKEVAMLGADVADLERRLPLVRGIHSASIEKVAKLEARVEQIREAATVVLGHAANLAELRQRGRWFGLLAEAFGRNGIPALIVEGAIPAIEDEANRVLARLTDGRFRVRLDSQRSTQRGEIRETLDVVVWDSRGERPLEGLSGGERQCVDLALRIGLAALLAHRSGRPLETLILDEAFTALDVGRRQRTIELLHDLAVDYRVMFVTHLPELADAFPVRFEISTENGTSVVRRNDVEKVSVVG